MSELASPVTARVEHVDKFERRRAELADATLLTLGEMGFARTSMREIAAKTDFSHGVLHYYFRDKIELIAYGVRRYKEQCVTRYDAVVAEATTPDELAEGFAAAMVATLLDDTAMHQLWYDLRTQAMFEPDLRSTVTDLDGQLEAMIWRVVAAYAQLAGADVSVPSRTAYSVFDGLFENSLMRHVAGDPEAPQRLRSGCTWLLSTLVARLS